MPLDSSSMSPEQRKLRDQQYFAAHLSEQFDRFEDMVQNMKAIAKMGGPELSVEERNYLSLGYKNVVGGRRNVWHAITNQIRSDEHKDSISHLDDYMAYRDKVEKELQSICLDALDLLDTYLIPRAANGESKVFYLKMKGDYLRYMAECNSGDSRKSMADKSNEAYKEATKVAAEQLASTQPIRLGLALNYSVFYYEILGLPNEACQLAREAFDNAIAELDALPEEVYRDSCSIMQLLRDNMDLWGADNQGKLAGENAATTEDSIPPVAGEAGDNVPTPEESVQNRTAP